MNIYHDLCLEIEAYEYRCEQLEKETTHIFNLMNRGPKTKLVASYSGMPNGNSDDTTLDKLYDRIQEVERRLNAERDILTDKKQAKQKIEGTMSEFNTLEGKVAYKRDIEGKSIGHISDELGFSYSYISKVSSRIGKSAKSVKELLVKSC